MLGFLLKVTVLFSALCLNKGLDNITVPGFTRNGAQESGTNAHPTEDPFAVSTSTENSVQPSEKVMYYNKVTKRIWCSCPVLLLIIGTAGNILSIIVMLQKSLRSSSTSFFLITLAVVDTDVLWSGLLADLLGYCHSIDIRAVSNAACKLNVFTVFWLSEFTSWILVTMTFERFVAVYFPHKAKELMSKRNCILMVATVAVLLGALNAHILDSFELKKKFCSRNPKYASFFKDIWPWIDYTFRSFAPFILLIAGNMSIVAKVALSSFSRRKGKTNQKNSGSVKMTSMTLILFTVSLMFFFTTTPYNINRILYDKFLTVQTPEASAFRALMFATVVNIYYVNHSFNFFLYCISGPKFRNELKGIFGIRTKVHPAPASQTLENSVKTPEE